MKFLKKIFSFLDKPQDDVLMLYVRCNHCKTVFGIRIDLRRDLNSTYGEGPAEFTLRKEAMDNKCYRLIIITMEFDSARKVLQQDIQGGTFVTVEEYQQYHASR